MATDYIVEKGTNQAKVLEVNTNARIFSRRDYMKMHDFNPLFDFILENQFTSVDVIHQIYNSDVVDVIEEFCDDNEITFQRHPTAINSITVPYIEDSDDKLILRMSYDTTAIVDEEYAKDKFKLARSIQGTELTPKTYIKSDDINVDELSNLEDFTYNGSSPNFILKKRYPDYEKAEFPKCLKFENKQQLTDYMNSIGDDVLLQEFINCNNHTNNKRLIHRSIDIVYGSELTTIPLGGYRVTNIVAEDIWENTWSNGTWGELALKDRGKYITYYLSDSLHSSNYVYDEDQSVLMADGSLKTFAEVSEEDMVKSLNIPELPLDEELGYNINVWTGSYSEVVTNSQLTDTKVVTKYSSGVINDYFLRLTFDDGNSYDDITSTNILIKSGSLVRFISLDMAVPGDEFLMYNVSESKVEIKTLTNIEVVWKEGETLGAIDVEPYDLFLPFVHNDYTLIQHNVCNQPRCRETGCATSFVPFFFNGFFNCNNCTYTQCFKVGSERRLKKNIKLIGKSNSGINIYLFEYINKSLGEGVYQGTMVDEVPEYAIVDMGEYKGIDYSKIDVEFKKIK